MRDIRQSSVLSAAVFRRPVFCARDFHERESDFIGKVRILSVKIVGKVCLKIKSVRKVTEKVTERRHLKMQFCNDAIDERAIRLP